MAITINAPMDNGKIVDVLAFAGQHSVHGPCWFVRSRGTPFHMDPGVRRHRVVWPDALLMPIRGDLMDSVPPVATRRLTEAEFDAAVDRWVQGVSA